jgi:hypothetical protein
MARAHFRLVEACEGTGDLMQNGAVLRRVRYRLDRYQGMREGSGMPVPGLHRLEGSLEAGEADVEAWPARVGESLTLRLADGRTVALTLADEDGRVLTEGHGPGRGCCCC